jgi:hypothetical protein
MMRTMLTVGMVAMAACTSSKAEEGGGSSPSPVPASAQSAPAPTPTAAPAALPLATGRQVVKGGETFALQGATVAVDRVTFVNNLCPPGAQCLTSGIIKTVAFSVTAGGAAEKTVLSEGMQRVVSGIMLRVVSVTAGPQAEIEASLPVAPAAAP